MCCMQCFTGISQVWFCIPYISDGLFFKRKMWILPAVSYQTSVTGRSYWFLVHTGTSVYTLLFLNLDESCIWNLIRLFKFWVNRKQMPVKHCMKRMQIWTVPFSFYLWTIKQKKKYETIAPCELSLFNNK